MAEDPFRRRSLVERSPPEHMEGGDRKRTREESSKEEITYIEREIGGEDLEAGEVSGEGVQRERRGDTSFNENIMDRIIDQIKAIKSNVNKESGGKVAFYKRNQEIVNQSCDGLQEDFITILRNLRKVEKELAQQRGKALELEIKILRVQSEGRQLEGEGDRRGGAPRRQEEDKWKGEVVQEIISLKEEVKQLTEKITTRGNVEGEKVEMRGTQEGQSGRGKSYAEIAQTKVAEKGWVTVVKSRREGTSAEDVKRKLVQRLDVEDLGPVTQVRKTRAGDVLVVTKDEDQNRKLRERVGTMESLEAGDAKERAIRIWFTGVDVGHTAVTLKQELWEQNRSIREGIAEEGYEEGLKLVQARRCRNPNKENWIAVVSKDVYELIMKRGQGKVYIDLVRVLVEDYVDSVRCYKCCGYGHTSRGCSERETCGRCGQEHREQECRAETQNCPCCERMGLRPREHTAWDRGCPVTQRRMGILKSRVWS